MCECVEWQESLCIRVPVWERGAWDSTFECTPCVRRSACLFANSEGEKGKGGEGEREGEEECCSVWWRGAGGDTAKSLACLVPAFLFFFFSSSHLFSLVVVSLPFPAASYSFSDLDSWCSDAAVGNWAWIWGETNACSTPKSCFLWAQGAHIHICVNFFLRIEGHCCTAGWNTPDLLIIGCPDEVGTIRLVCLDRLLSSGTKLMHYNRW